MNGSDCDRDRCVQRDRTRNDFEVRRGRSIPSCRRRDGAALAAVVKEAAALGGRADLFVADVTAPDMPDRIVAACLERFGTLTTLVNAAGIIATGTIESTTDEQWAKVMDINLHAPFRLMRAATDALIASGGSIVNVSSVNGLRSFPGLIAYCVSKSAVDHLTRCAALELAVERRACERRESRRDRLEPSPTRRHVGGVHAEAFLTRSRERRTRSVVPDSPTRLRT